MAAAEDDEVGAVAVDERLNVDLAVVGKVVEEGVQKRVFPRHEGDLERSDGLAGRDAAGHELGALVG